MRLLSIFLALSLISCTPKKKELHIFTWGNYINHEIIESFEKKYDCHIVIDLYDSNEAMYAKLKAGAIGYDLVFPSNYFLEIMERQNLLQEIPHNEIPNLKYLDRPLLDQIVESDFQFAIPYMISFTGVGYRSDRFTPQKFSWEIFGDPSFYKRMTMLNDMREVLGAALKFLGYSINTINKNEIDEATKLLISWKKNLAKFESEQYMNGIATREYLVVQGYSGQLLQVANDDEGVGFFLPEEGVPISCDYIAITKDAPESMLALQFINYLFEPEIAAKNINFTMYLAPNTAAYALLPKKLQSNPYLFPDKEIIERSEVIKDLGSSIELYLQAWEKVRYQ